MTLVRTRNLNLFNISSLWYFKMDTSYLMKIKWWGTQLVNTSWINFWQKPVTNQELHTEVVIDIAQKAGILAWKVLFQLVHFDASWIFPWILKHLRNSEGIFELKALYYLPCSHSPILGYWEVGGQVMVPNDMWTYLNYVKTLAESCFQAKFNSWAIAQVCNSIFTHIYHQILLCLKRGQIIFLEISMAVNKNCTVRFSFWIV